MAFIFGLTDRIRKLIGLECTLDEDFSFFQSGGNNHSIQFFIKNFTDEYRDLGDWDQRNLFLMDISSELDVEFELDDDSMFAVFEYKNGKETRMVQAIMDLRDNYLTVVYYFGDPKSCQRLNQKLMNCGQLHACFLGSDILEQTAFYIEQIVRIEYKFEQLSSMFLEPVVVQGVLKGEPAHQGFLDFIRSNRSYFNISAIAGHITDGSQGIISFHQKGTIQVDSCRLSSFMEIANRIFTILRNKYQNLMENYVIGWDETQLNGYMELNGNYVEYRLKRPVEKLDGIIRFLTCGDKTINLFGISERISRKLWSIKSTEVNTMRQIEFEISDSVIRAYLKTGDSIPLLDSVEFFLRTHVEADIENTII